MDKEIKTRLGWVELYRETGNAGLTCRRCGISRPTLRLWTRRYEEEGIGGLRSRSRRPKHSPNQKRTPTLEEHILKLRQKRNLGARRIQSDLLWEDDIRLSLGTIHKVLVNAEVGPLKRPPRRKHCKRYERPVPGDRVQMDTCKISTGIYQYTAIDDCTRCRVLRVYPRRTAKNTLEFLDAVIEEMGFPVQRVQTDRGSEFFAYKVQERLMDYGIKFRPIRPASPHLNGKVERSQKTDKIEFYAICNLDAPGLEERLSEWQHYYNWRRPHGALKGKTPMQRASELSKDTPYWDDLSALYDPTKERIQERNYQVDLRLRELKECL